MKINRYTGKFLLIVIFSLILSAFFLAASYGPTPIPWALIISNALKFFVLLLACVLFLFLIGTIWKWHERSPSHGTFETYCTLLLARWKKSRASRNAAQIAPALQNFLFTVLRRGQGVLNVLIGADPSCLTPQGHFLLFRNNAFFYRFELLLSASPEQDLDILKRLLNQFVYSELLNFGIVDLPSVFTTSWGTTVPSVYLDRLIYDEVRHALVFDVLFVGSDSAAKTLAQSIDRDKPQVAKSEAEVYDDEL